MPLSLEKQRIINQLREAQRQAKERIKRLRGLEAGKKTDFWKALAEELDYSIKANEAERDQILESEVTQDPVKDFIRCKQHAFAIRAYKGVKANVEQAEDKALRLNERSADYSRKINELMEKGGDRGKA